MAEAHPNVQYRDIPGFPGYRVGSDGSVWSRRGRQMMRPGDQPPWRRMALHLGTNGYFAVTLCVSGKTFVRSLHRLILEAFAGPCPPGMEACHLNGDRTDCRPINLRWDTRKNNHADKRKHGTDNRGHRHQNAKVTDADVTEIRARYAAGETQASIASAKGIDRANVGYIVRRDTWDHVA